MNWRILQERGAKHRYVSFPQRAWLEQSDSERRLAGCGRGSLRATDDKEGVGVMGGTWPDSVLSPSSKDMELTEDTTVRSASAKALFSKTTASAARAMACSDVCWRAAILALGGRASSRTISK